MYGSFTSPCDVGLIHIYLLHVRKLTYTEAKQFPQGKN